MADQGKSKSEHLSQVLIVLITAVVGPIAVWYTTNSNSPLNAANQTLPALTATLPANPAAFATTAAPWAETPSTTLTLTSLTVTAAPTSTLTTEPTPTLSATATVPTKPSGVLPAGTPVVVDGLSLLVSASDVSVEGSLLRLQVHLTNQTTSRTTLTFSPSAISIRDNTGKTYAIDYGEGKDACKRPDLSIKKTVQIEPGKTLVLQPLNIKDASDWCLKDKNSVLPFYTGPLASGAQSLTITFDGLGPFKGFSIEIGL